MWKSFGYACEGLLHAFQHERNLRLCTLGFGALVLLLIPLALASWEWVTILLAGGTLLAVELLNTALERTIDVIDEHRKALQNGEDIHMGLKAAKDVAAAASLASLVTLIVIVGIIIGSKIELLFL